MPFSVLLLLKYVVMHVPPTLIVLMQVIAISVSLELANTDALKMTFCVIIKQFAVTNAHLT